MDKTKTMKYKLKEEAKQFFDKELHNSKYSLVVWQDQNIHHNLIEEATEPNTFLEYGYSVLNSDSRSCGQYQSKDGGQSRHFFTLVTENADYKLHNYITNNKEELTKLLNETVQVFIKNNNLN